MKENRVVLAKDLQEILVEALTVYEIEGQVKMPAKEFEAFQRLLETADLMMLVFWE